MTFHDINLPKFIEVFAIGQPEFSTSSALTISGRELRNIDREYARQKYLIRGCRLSAAEFEAFNSFFRARKGAGFSFRFRDPADYKVNKQLIAIGDGAVAEFQLFKQYDDAIAPYLRQIIKPVKNKVKIYIDEEEINPEINYDKGVVTLDAPLARLKNLIAEFEFDIEVRFNGDNFGYSYMEDGSIELSPLELVEVSQ